MGNFYNKLRMERLQKILAKDINDPAAYATFSPRTGLVWNFKANTEQGFLGMKRGKDNKIRWERDVMQDV